MNVPTTSRVNEGHSTGSGHRFGLMFYQSRFYDPQLGRFTQADTIIPESTQGTQAWDRYAGMNNNPVRFNDPTGHMIDKGDAGGTCLDPKYCSKTITILLGGVNPASLPGQAGDDGNPPPPVTTKGGAAALGAIELVNFGNMLGKAFAPSSPMPVDVYLTYTILPDGSIDVAVFTVDNHDGGSDVGIDKVAIQFNDTQAGTYVLDPSNGPIIATPGDVATATICDNCIANHVLPFSFTGSEKTQVTITAVIGAFFDYGYPGTSYGTFNFSYTIH